MFYVYLKFAVYLLAGIVLARIAINNFSSLASGINQRHTVLKIILMGVLSLASFYLAISNAAKFIYPHLTLTH